MDASDTTALCKRMDELQEALEQATKGMAALATGPWSDSCSVVCSCPSALLKVLDLGNPLRGVRPQLKEPVKESLDVGEAINAQTPRTTCVRSVSS